MLLLDEGDFYPIATPQVKLTAILIQFIVLQ